MLFAAWSTLVYARLRKHALCYARSTGMSNKPKPFKKKEVDKEKEKEKLAAKAREAAKVEADPMLTQFDQLDPCIDPYIDHTLIETLTHTLTNTLTLALSHFDPFCWGGGRACV